jgi:hypothetical protein
MGLVAINHSMMAGVAGVVVHQEVIVVVEVVVHRGAIVVAGVVVGFEEAGVMEEVAIEPQ